MLINAASKRTKKSISSSSIPPLLFQLERNYLAFLSWQQEWSTQRASTAARNDPRPVLLALVQDFFHSHNQNRIKQHRQAAQPLSGNTPLPMTCTCAEGLWYSAPPETLAVDQSLRSLTDKFSPIVNRQNQTRSAASLDLPLVGDVLRALSSHYLVRTTEKSAREGDDWVNDTISWLATMLGRYLQQEITRAISSPCAMIHAAGLFPSCDYCRTAAELMRLCRAFPSASPQSHCSAQVEWYCFLTTVLLRTPPSSATSFDSQLLLDLPCSVLVKFFDQQFVKCDRTVPDTVPQRSLYVRLLYRVGRAAQKWLAMPVSGVVAPSRPRLSQKLSTAYTQWMKERLSTFATSALCPSSSSPSLHSVPHYVLVMQRNLDLGNEVVTTAQFQEALTALQKRILTAAAPSVTVTASKRSVGALPTTQQNPQRKGATVATVTRRRPPAKRRRRQDTSSDESEEEDTTSSSSESEEDEEERPVAHRHLQKTTTTTAPPAKKPRTTGAAKPPNRSGSPKVLSEDETLAAVFAKSTPMRAQRKK